MRDYQQGKVYVIRSPHTDDEYIGSTIQTLCQRMSGHRANKNCRSHLIIDAGDAYIELIEEYPCDNIEQLRRREGEIIRSRPNCINRNVAGRTEKEWTEDNKTILRQKRLVYLEITKEKHRASWKAYREKHKENRKKYEKENKEALKAYHKQYREKNKEKMSQKAKERYRKAKSASEAEQKENE